MAQQKYAEERARRLRPDGLAQYVEPATSTSDKVRRFLDDPWIDRHALDEQVPALTDRSRCNHLIIGAGFGGLLFAVRLIQAGFMADEIRIVDSAGGYGGTWYWNRFPGLTCDIESYMYLPLLEEMGYMPKHKYVDGTEVRDYIERIVDRWQLRDKTMFGVEVKSLAWDDDGKEWIVKMKQHRSHHKEADITVRSHVVISASGILHHPKLPNLPGIEDFQGHSFHTSRWDYPFTGGSPTDPSLTNLKGLKVGIIGTGATAIQAVPHLAKWAKELYVFQRTPSSVNRRDNRPTDAGWWAREIQGKKGWQRERIENFNAHLANERPPPPINLVGDGWSKMPSYSALVGGPTLVMPAFVHEHVAALHALDLPHQEMIRARVEEMVKDPTVAEKLKPWYPSWCKRPCFHDDYLSTFNLPHVSLVDTAGQGVDRVTSHGVVVGGSEYEVDLLIFSTGFRPPGLGSPAQRAGISVTGREGQSLDDEWAQRVSTLHGVFKRGFPNLFWPGPLQAGATANYTFVVDQLATHVAYILAESARKAAQQQQQQPEGKEDPPRRNFSVEPTAEAEEAWGNQIVYGIATFAAMKGCTPSYLNWEGETDQITRMEDLMTAARRATWGFGIEDFVDVLEAWRADGSLTGLDITA